MTERSERRVLVVRTDSDGDVLLSGPAVRAVARAARVTMLVAPSGAAAARLLPGVDEVLAAPCPWSGTQPPPVDPEGTLALVDELRARRFDAAVVLTSFHQSPLPSALLLRLAGVPHITAASEDYPGSLLDLRLVPARPGDERHEVERGLDTVRAAGFPPATGDDARLAVRHPLPWPAAADDLEPGRFVVVHPGASVPARAPRPQDAAAMVESLRAAGWAVGVTGGPTEVDLTAAVVGRAATHPGAGPRVADLGGCTTLPELAAVLAAAACVVVGNTGPAHLAAAVGTPVVSLFAPVVPARWWAPWGVPRLVLGDQSAACAGTRARECPVDGHPCLASIRGEAVVAAVTRLAGHPPSRTPADTKADRRAERSGHAGRVGAEVPAEREAS